MNFFKSVFSDDPDPPRSQPESESPNNASKSKVEEHPDRGSSSMGDPRLDVNPTSDDASGGGWNFGGLIKTLTSKSETIIETYRRDLKEFGSGLRKEIEVAQGSLETVGQAIDEFGNTVVKGTAMIISQGKDTILAADLESDLDNNDNNPKHDSGKRLNVKPYTRFDAQVSAIQSDASTYCEEPEDLNDYKKWKSEFSLGGKSEEIESFLSANDAMESIYKRVVPSSIDHETFWCRYYYLVHKLKKAEDVRAKLVRGMSKEEEEDMSWDFEDDDEGDHGGKMKPNHVTNKEIAGEHLGKRADADMQAGSSAISNEGEIRRPNMEEKQNLNVETRDNVIQDKEQGNKTDNFLEELKVESSEVVNETGEKSCNVDNRGKESMKEADIDKASKIDGDIIVKNNDPVGKSSEKVVVEGKAGDSKSSNEDEENEDLGWDEIEDLSSIDEKKATQSGSMDKVDLRKRLSAAKEEEDLSWDIEDDDDDDNDESARA